MTQPKRIVIVGGVAGGASAAARTRRLSEDAQILMVERGPHISFANCGMPYYISGVIPERSRLLVQTPESMRNRFGIDVRVHTEAVRIDRAARTVTLRDVKTGGESQAPYDELILSPGAQPLRPPVPGLDGPMVFTLRNLADMDAIREAIDPPSHKATAGPPPRRALVIGGGYVGLEMAEALRHRKLDVALVELTSQVFVSMDPEMVAPVDTELKLHGVQLLLNTSVTSVTRETTEMTVLLSDGQKIPADLIVVAVGVRPESKLAADAGLPIGQRGGIIVDEHMRTADPHVYAVGDVIESPDLVSGQRAFVPLAGPANRQGRIAADNALGRTSIYRRTQGTAVCKVFNLTLGATGASENSLRRNGRSYEKVYVHPASHAGYYPGASPMSLKLLFDPADGKVLGAQAVGAAGVDKRIDVLAVAIRAGLTVYDLEDLELSYAPPYGSAKDPVNYAGFVAANVLRGDARICHTPDVIGVTGEQALLDVRTPTEAAGGTIPGAVNIPVDELRSRLGELPKDKELLVFCQVGLRGYLACRILTQKGFRARNLTGGYKTYQAFKGMMSGPKPAKEIHQDAGEGGDSAQAGERALQRKPTPAAACR